MLIENTLFGEVNKIKIAIERIKDAYDISKFHNKGALYVAFSGGKDSICIAQLCKEANVPYELHYNATTVDPFELLKFIKENYPETKFEKPKYSMWQLIAKRQMPPTRLVRYCCKELKEKGGEGRICITGVRKYESVKRSKRKAFETIENNNKEKILFDDNGEFRNAIENCKIKGKIVCNPIIDWTDEDVWEFIKLRNMKYCKLYDEGFKRIGCIGCPMASKNIRKTQLERHPYFKNKYLEAFNKMLKNIPIEKRTWNTPEDVMKWWLEEENKIPEGQQTIEIE